MARRRGNGEGTLYRRADGLWVGRVMVGRRADGRPDRRKVTGTTRAEAQRKVAELRAKGEGGLLGAPGAGRGSVADFLERWLQASRARVRPRTHERYAELVEHHLKPSIGAVRLSALRPDHIERLHAIKLGDGLSPRTVVHIHAVLHTALESAVKWGEVPRNVAAVAGRPRAPRHEIKPPSAADVVQLLGTAKAVDDRATALWTVAVYSGCRLGELLALQWNDVDLKQGTIAIRRTLERIDDENAPVYGEPKTAKSRRTVALPLIAIEELRHWRVRQTEERLAVGPDYANYGLVFTTEIGTPLSGRNAHRLFKLALGRAGLPSSVRVHDLRHFAATLMLSAGVHPKIASERLGHSTVGITLDLYSHAVQGLDADAADRMAKAMEAVQLVP